ncbi:MAG TPA: EI24 domain-containing protein, partial [Ferruginibacter sp.]|nr:EI24 domain-containing protein [Ferruginibacter sp.]
LAGWITPLIALFVEFYYVGFSMLDYNSERNNLNYHQSIRFVGQHKGLAIGNGMVYYAMHLIPIVGWLLAPSYAVVAATLSILSAKKKNVILS